MGIFDSLYTGVSGLKAAELQINTTGNNISNADAVFYTRQRAFQGTGMSIKRGGLHLGTGTQVETIKRLHDEHAYYKLKNATTQQQYTDYLGKILQEASQRFPDTQGTGILQDYKNYNDAWNNFASNPSDSASKVDLIESANTLTQNIQKTLQALDKMQQTVNEEIKQSVDEINNIGQEIANINKQLEQKEILPTDNANQLRDRRDELELRLSKLVDAVAWKGHSSQDNTLDQTITDSGKYYDLSIKGFSIVNGSSFHPLKLDNKNPQGFYNISYEVNDENRYDLTGKITGGQLGAQLDLRGRNYDGNTHSFSDGTLQDYKDMLNTFTKTLITQTNNVYAQAATEKVVSDDLKGLKSNTSLMSYDKNIQAGSFDLVVYDSKGDPVAKRTIKIDVNTTIEDVIKQINANIDDTNDKNDKNDLDDYFKASYQYDGKSDSGNFQMNSLKQGYKISFKDNGTNFPGALNVSSFFNGQDANNINVNSSIRNDPNTLKASSSGIDGKNDVANAMLQLQTTPVNFYNKNGTVDTMTLDGYYRKFTGQIASNAESNNFAHSTNKTVYNTVYGEYQSKSGVNTNEELAALIKYQASYGAAAKIVTTVDKMLDTLLGLKS
ncbi:flagellar hook-associated protein FlgK [Campylobacter insulaenigrae]|uniref:flagellar hook-associated protein FlgK n=1 Tax=Campylobacter insulaenigrae TaxID=260714 RepID=UPI002152BC66|nr:flagellar hook-associated protein FlgK [Campylobacter insulaenigrae]MCR6570489.1 flagellar hook-associated protein FlgK [Campylobacter insulaenigrae]MCR6587953.1 flagellar hook-associated protein FlgK [Campylobacter insulaenigrae]